jgi:hypothetical protein
MKPNICTHDPRQTFGPIGMYHCPECGEMQIAGFEHTGIMEDEDWEELEKKLENE